MLRPIVLALLLASATRAVDITDIQGPAYQSPLAGQVVDDVTGVIVAKVCFIILVPLFGVHTLRRTDTGSGLWVSPPLIRGYPTDFAFTA